MTSQREVIEAFINFDNQPQTASNFRMVMPEDAADDYTAYLIGGERVVYAKREPIRQATMWRNLVSYQHTGLATLGVNHLRRQQRKVRYFLRNADDNDTIQLTENADAPPTTDEIDDDLDL